jgi:hypothetical protein
MSDDLVTRLLAAAHFGNGRIEDAELMAVAAQALKAATWQPTYTPHDTPPRGSGRPAMTRIVIPRSFARDREFRELDNGNGRWTRQGFDTELTAEQLSELRSDADQYADARGFDFDVEPHLRGVCRGAKICLERIKLAAKER